MRKTGLRIHSTLSAATSSILTLVFLLLYAGTTHAFVGTIAVALGRAAEVDPIKVSFSADGQVETEDNKFSTKIYFNKDRLRDEMQMAGQSMVMIQRFDLNKSWMLMGQGMYMENDLGESEQAPDFKLIEKKVVGQEVVNGMQTTKYKTVYQSSRGKFGGFTWINEDNIAVKGFMISDDGGRKQRILFELDNIKIGDQNAALFELPPGARKMDMGGLSGMMGMGGMSGSKPPAGMPQMTPPPSAPEAQRSEEAAPNEGEDSFAGEVTEAAQDSAKEATVEETRRAVKEGVTEGFRSLFHKKP